MGSKLVSLAGPELDSTRLPASPPHHGDEPSRVTNMETNAEARAILEPWFRHLKSHLSIAQDSHLPFRWRERARNYFSDNDPGYDRVDMRPPVRRCWLRVRVPMMSAKERLRRREARGASAVDDASTEKALSRMGEALLLTSVLAAIDYDAWLCALQEVARLALPFGLDRNQRLLCRFEINVGDVLCQAHARAHVSLKASLAGGPWSALFCESPGDAFVRDLRRLKPLLNLSRLEPTPLRIVLPLKDWAVDRYGSAAEVKYVQGTIALFKSLADRSVNKLVGFRLHSVDVDLSLVRMDQSSLEATTTFLRKCEVRIQSLTLPATSSGEREVSLTRWNDVVRAAAGLSNGSLHLHSLHVKESHLQADLVEPLFAAMASTQIVQALSIHMTSVVEEVVRGRLECLGRTILKANSISSIKTLSLWAHKITVRQVQSMADAIVDDGIEELDVQPCGRGQSSFETLIKTLSLWAPQSIVQQIESVVAAIGDAENEAHDEQPCGRGQSRLETRYRDSSCSRYSREYLARHPADRIHASGDVEHDDQSRLETLAIRLTGEDNYDEVFIPLLRVLGGRLTGLHLNASHTSDKTIEAIVRYCPRLRRLWIQNAALSAMEVFARGYELGLPLESLVLQDTGIAPKAFEAFLAVLGQQGAAASTLRCFRIGCRLRIKWPRSTFDLLRQALVSNQTLSHVHMLVDYRRGDLRRDFHDSLAREPHLILPLPTAQRCAFISVLNTVDAIGNFDVHLVMSRVLAFITYDVPRAVRINTIRQ